MQVVAAIYHNETPEDRFFKYNPQTSTLIYAHEVTVEDDADTNVLLAKVFRAANRVDGSEVEQVPDGVRSLSVGDVVKVKGKSFACDMVGWTMIEDTQAFLSVFRGMQKGE